MKTLPLLLGALLLLACQSPVSSVSKSTTPGTVTISFVAATRTVVADLSSSIASYGVTLTCSGQTTITTTTSATSVSIPSVAAGTWTISVIAYNAVSAAIGAGSTTVSVTLGSSPSASVTISGTQGGTGAYSLTVWFPTSVGITSVTGVLWSGTSSVSSATVASASFGTPGEGYNSATFTNASITAANYRLELIFYRGSVVAGDFSEAVNVWNNVTSDQWWSSSGTLSSYETFAAANFNSSDATLSNLTSTGTLSPGFTSTTYAYVISGGSSVTFTPTATLSGQAIAYQLDSTTGSWTALSSGTETPSVSPGHVINLRVTATDQTTQVYSVAVVSNLLTNSTWVSDLSGWTVTVGGTTLARGPSPLSGYDCVVTSYDWSTLVQTVSLTGAGYSTTQLDATSTVYMLGVWVGGYSPCYYLTLELLDSSSSVVATVNLGNGGSPLTDSGGYKTLCYTNTSGLAIRSARVTLAGKDNLGWADCYGAEFYAPALNVQ